MSTIILDALGNLLRSLEKNKGVKGLESGGYTWSELKGGVIVPTSGGSAATREEWKTGVFGLGYNLNDIQDWAMHAEHIEVIGGDKYIHPHIRHNGTEITGDTVISFVVCHNFGHRRTGSPAPITFTLTIPATALAQHDTYIPDILFMKEGGGAIGVQNLVGGGVVTDFIALDSLDLLPDDDFMETVKVTTLPVISGGLSTRLFIPSVDIHREVTDGSGTKNKDPHDGSFYHVP